jgi:DNA-3-methyladenine glycosylase II
MPKLPNQSFDDLSFYKLCDQLAKKDAHIKEIISTHGYPPIWSREPSFETLIHIILEQQVSLASAKAALVKLKEKIGAVTPKKLLQLSDEELKACYFSRQKTVYARCLATAIVNGELSIKKLQSLSNDEIRETLTKIKGIGNWTVDVFLMMVLHRTDLFPTGDIALMNSVRFVKSLEAHSTREEILALAEAWRPNRTVAAFLFWHAYIKRKNIKF